MLASKPHRRRQSTQEQTTSKDDARQHLMALAAAEAAQARADIREFVEGSVAGDKEGFERALVRLSENSDALRKAFRRIARESKVPMTTRMCFLSFWFSFGEHWRNEVGDDRILLPALRALMPSYRGSAVELFRGDSMWNRRRRTYGPCWSRSRIVAEQHAAGPWRSHHSEGSVLLRTLAPANAIICALPDHVTSDEEEYIVDRRFLNHVTVLKRYSQS